MKSGYYDYTSSPGGILPVGTRVWGKRNDHHWETGMIIAVKPQGFYLVRWLIDDDETIEHDYSVEKMTVNRCLICGENRAHPSQLSKHDCTGRGR